MGTKSMEKRKFSTCITVENEGITMRTHIRTGFELTVHLALVHTEQLAAGCQPDCDISLGQCTVPIEKMPRTCRLCMQLVGIIKTKL